MGSDTNTRAAAIAALGGVEKARGLLMNYRGWEGAVSVNADILSSICDLALSALDGDGDARLRELQETPFAQERRKVVEAVGWDCCRSADPACAAGCLFERAVRNLRPATEPEAPEPGNPPGSPDGWEARIAEWEQDYISECQQVPGRGGPLNAGYIRVRRDALDLMRDLAASAEKAEASLHAAHGAFGKIDAALGGHGWATIDDVVARAQGIKPRDEQHRRMTAKHVADLNSDIADLRAQLAAIDEAIADRGVPERDCSLPLPERVSNILSELKEWRHEAATAQAKLQVAAADCELLRRSLIDCGRQAGCGLADNVSTGFIAGEPGVHGELRSYLGNLRIRANRAEADAEVAQAKLAEAEKQRDAAHRDAENEADAAVTASIEAARYKRERDAALAAQNARAVEELDGFCEQLSAVIASGDDDLGPVIDRMRRTRDALRTAQPAEPAPAQVPAFEGDPKDCAFRREGDEVLRAAEERTAEVYDPDTKAALRAVIDLVLSRALGGAS